MKERKKLFARIDNYIQGYYDVLKTVCLNTWLASGNNKASLEEKIYALNQSHRTVLVIIIPQKKLDLDNLKLKEEENNDTFIS